MIKQSFFTLPEFITNFKESLVNFKKNWVKIIILSLGLVTSIIFFIAIRIYTVFILTNLIGNSTFWGMAFSIFFTITSYLFYFFCFSFYILMLLNFFTNNSWEIAFKNSVLNVGQYYKLVLLFLILSSVSFIFFGIPFVFFLVFYSFSLIIFHQEKAGIKESLLRSKKLVKDFAWEVFYQFFLFSLIFYPFLFLEFYFPIVGRLFFNIILFFFIFPLVISFLLTLYNKIKEKKQIFPPVLGMINWKQKFFSIFMSLVMVLSILGISLLNNLDTVINNLANLIK